MKTHIAPTTMAAYRSLQADNALQPKEEAVMSLFGPRTKLSRQQVGEIARMPINCVTGRVKSLLEKGILVEEGTRLDPCTRKHQALLRLPAGQLELI